MLTYEEANSLVLKRHRDCKVTSTMDAGNSFIITLRPNYFREDQIVLDGFFRVDKRTKQISEYSPVMDPEEFKKAMKNVVYKEEK